MSATKFMTATGSNRELQIKRSNENHVQIRQFDPEFHTHQAKTFFLNPSDAPALALAVLEAAGVEKKLHRRFEFELGSPGHLKAITYELDLYIREEIERATEAKEQAELEAEALELFNISQGTNLGAWAPRIDRSVINIWVEIAKRAREIAGRAEK